jgi:hypothetical protein
MADDLVNLLRSYYGMSEETCRELIGEIKDMRSLRSLAGYRSVNTPPNTSLSVGA